jgi:hypothetical protein
MIFDELSNCDRCGGDACYISDVNKDIKNYYCFGCGFQSNSIMTIDSQFLKEQMSILPDIYKALMVEDEKGKVWMPAYVSNEKGMLFVDGTDVDNWTWAAVKMVPTTEEDDEITRKNKFKPDNSTKKQFNEKDFMDALSYLGLLPENK